MLNHLWQSSLFVVAIWALTLVLRGNRAAVRYWLWLAASVKFLVPFSLLIRLGGLVPWRTASPVAGQPQVSFVMDSVSRASTAPVVVAGVAPGFNFVPILMGVWICGIAVGVVFWMRGWWRVREVLRTATGFGRRNRLPYIVSSRRMEPGVFGIFRPVLLLPEGIADRLTAAQLEAIIAHELCHVRRRDNLTAAIHMVVETIFWFHPVVWWIRARLIDERERACDEEVLRLGSDAEVYAASILEACKLYLESPLACVAGVTGSDLRKRIEAIMANRRAVRVNFSKKLLLVVAGVAAVMGPVVVGVLNAPFATAQSHPEFDVASVKPDSPGGISTGNLQILPGGRLSAQKVLLRFFIQNAYEIKPFQILGAPDWINSQGYDIEAKADGNPSADEMRRMMQALLEQRFKMKAHRDTRELPVYALTAAKGGMKLPEPKEGSCLPGVEDVTPRPPASDLQGPCGRAMIAISRFNGARMQGGKIAMPELIRLLSYLMGRTVIDRTGFTGLFDVRLEFALDDALDGIPHPPTGESQGPSIFVAVQEQLGLKLDSTKGPVEVLVIDHVERPSAN